MGQYWCIYNRDKKQKLNPWDFGEVAKLMEWPMDGPGGMHSALVILLLEKSSLGDGAGDWYFEDAPTELQELIGSWAGDEVFVVGDYTHHVDDYADENYTDISKQMVELMSYEPSLQRKLCANVVDPDHKWIGYQYSHDKSKKETLADRIKTADEIRESGISMAPDFVIEKKRED